mmetsp:Transcript_42825/g.101643  ORF Transcript_42825/g.101643 Transcript_42825/m.101643 type:complete len:233 (+) Transcript_42825:412-1110(+)
MDWLFFQVSSQSDEPAASLHPGTSTRWWLRYRSMFLRFSGTASASSSLWLRVHSWSAVRVETHMSGKVLRVRSMGRHCSSVLLSMLTASRRVRSRSAQRPPSRPWSILASSLTSGRSTSWNTDPHISGGRDRPSVSSGLTTRWSRTTAWLRRFGSASCSTCLLRHWMSVSHSSRCTAWSSGQTVLVRATSHEFMPSRTSMTCFARSGAFCCWELSMKASAVSRHGTKLSFIR